MRQPVRATRDRAATLARLTEQAMAQRLTSSERGQSPALCVKILTAIPAGDYRQRDAMVMKLDAGVLVETGQTVKVRHGGEAAIAANTIVTPEPCGQLGLCFVREVQVVKSGLTARRFLRLVGPIDPVTTGATADYTTAWKFGPWFGRKLPAGQSPIPGTATGGYYIDQDLSAAQTAVGGSFRWLKYMQPLRFEVYGFPGQYTEPVYRYQKPDLTGLSIRYIEEVIQLAAGEANVTGVNHHLSPMLFSSIQSPAGGVCSTKVGQTISTAEQPAPQFGSASYYSRVLIMFARLWLNGVDKTGIVARPAGITNVDAGGVQLGGYDEVAWPAFAIEPHGLIGQSCYIDVWPRYDIRGARQGTSVTRQVGWVDPANNGVTLDLNSTDYASTPNVNDSRWDFAFDAYGPGGLTTLTASYVDDPANEWKREPTTDGQLFSKFPANPQAGDKGYRILFRYVRGDRAQVVYTIYTYYMTGGGGIFSPYLTARANAYYYSPPDTGDYSGVMVKSGYTVKSGRWTPSSPTVFAITGGASDATSVKVAEFQYDAQNGIATVYDGIPLAITVTKVT